MATFNFIKIFSNVPQESILAIWDMKYLFQQYGIDFFPGIFQIHFDLTTIYSRQFQKVQLKTNSEYEHLVVLKCKTKTRFK